MNEVTGQSRALPEIRQVSFADIAASLTAGWRDFLIAPLFGLFFSAFYVVGGLLI